MIITIQGKQGEGKTALIKKICEAKKVLSIDENVLKETFWTGKIDNDIDFILIDEVVSYEETRNVFTSGILTVRRQRQEPFNFKMPDVILVCQTK